jgi:hypothetical protein
VFKKQLLLLVIRNIEILINGVLYLTDQYLEYIFTALLALVIVEC